MIRKISKQKCAEYLQGFLEQEKKISELSSFLNKFGIDINNYEDKYCSFAKELLAVEIGCSVDDIDWWLYEDVEKIYYINKKPLSVKKPEEFINYYRKD
jgi:hypothetical protein